MRKRCGCGKDSWETCPHPWGPTDQGAAVVVKGPTRVFWAHKTSVAAFSESEIPVDVRVCLYGAESDSNTLAPHLQLLQRDLPGVISKLEYVLADDGYQGNHRAVAVFGNQARLIVPVHPRQARAGLAETFDGIDHFTPVGFPICQGGHRFVLRGRDISGQRYIWAAPDDGAGRPVCAGCPCAQGSRSEGFSGARSVGAPGQHRSVQRPGGYTASAQIDPENATDMPMARHDHGKSDTASLRSGGSRRPSVNL